ncbi:hypothetical protein JW935_10425 [candidate division KSB1 bacterium]|nr:hypothetical protein [candidate division KSB1 bacterium]
MKILWKIIGWFFTLLFGLFFISMLLTQNWLAVLVLFAVVLLCLPPGLGNTMLKS